MGKPLFSGLVQPHYQQNTVPVAWVPFEEAHIDTHSRHFKCLILPLIAIEALITPDSDK